MTSPFHPAVRRLALLVASLASTAAVLASGAQPATGADPKPAPTNATITWDSQDIKVKVTSPKATCKPNRRAFVVYKPAAGAVESAAIHGRTNNNGVLTFSDVGTPIEAGKIFAYVGKTRNTCRPGQSNVSPFEGQEMPIRAGEPARSYAKLSFNGRTFKVKVTSPKASCANGRRVEVIAYQRNPSFAVVFFGRTDNNGVMTLSPEAARTFGAPSVKLTAFTRKSPACAVGQSNTVGVPIA